jgi:hypothetical protein
MLALAAAEGQALGRSLGLGAATGTRRTISSARMTPNRSGDRRPMTPSYILATGHKHGQPGWIETSMGQLMY